MTDAIAVVGMACRYPDANSPQQLWENILARRRAFRRIPSGRINLNDYLANKNDPGDSFYISEAAVIEGYQFDRVKYHIAGSTYRSVDLTHWLALDIANQALIDAGFPDANGLPKKNTGVLIGNTLTGEFSRAALLRLRWPYVRRVLEAQLCSIGWLAEQRQDFLAQTEINFKAPFEPVNEETLAGGLANTIAGRICNYFDLAGGGYTVDGACSSSLLAITSACSGLVSGDLDVAIAGGVDLSLDPFELIGFAKVTALTTGEMLVYDKQSQGFLPGEGCGMVVLMRHEDAIAQGLRCYATIAGWGISSDGSGGITRPEISGQRLAIQRAYQRAGYDISTVISFEGHGTGTKVGDQVELGALSQELKAHEVLQKSYISSVKANIGHTKAAAGIAGFIKSVMALDQQIIPPATGFYNPNPALETTESTLQVSVQGQCWPDKQALRMGVSSFGFGGINVHLALQGKTAKADKKELSIQEKKLISSYQDAELFFFSAKSVGALQTLIQQVLDFAAALSYAELIGLAATLSEQASIKDEYRAALVADSPKELQNRLAKLLAQLKQLEPDAKIVDVKASIYFDSGFNKPRIAFLFPGQAAPVRLNGGLMASRFSLIDVLYQRVNLYQTDNINSTALAQPAIITSQLAGLQLLQQFGITAQSVLGHSLGELSALYYTGAMDKPALLRIAIERGRIMADAPEGSMASIECAGSKVQQLLADEKDIVIAAYNAAQQTVIAGQSTAIKHFANTLNKQGINTSILPIAHAFHSPLMTKVSAELGNFFHQEKFQSVTGHCISSITGQPLTADSNIPELLCQQLTSPVLFAEAAKKVLAISDLCIEVGPGHIISGLLANFEGHNVPVIAMDSTGDSLKGLLNSIAAAYVIGSPVNKSALFEDRFYRSFDLDWQPVFFTNPCELAPLADDQTRLIKKTTELPPVKAEFEAISIDPQHSPIELVKRLVAKRTELPLDSLTDNSRLLIDLHLNSISVTELVVEAARRMALNTPAAPMDYANVTIAELADSLALMKNMDDPAQTHQSRYPDGVDSWVRAYTLQQRPVPLTPTALNFQGLGEWQFFATGQHEKFQDVLSELKHWGSKGVLVVIADEFKTAHIELLLQASHAALNSEQGIDYFVLLQQCPSPAAAVIKTLHLEAPHIITLILEVPLSHPQLKQWLISELQAVDGYVQACYDETGLRHQATLELLTLGSGKQKLIMNAHDVMLVTGGGKGIAAESALMLAKLSGATLAIIGRSDPETDQELAANLQRFTAKAIKYRYIAADVSCVDQVANTIAEFERELGSITAVVHGAGVNHPKLLKELTLNAFTDTLAPKVQGLHNILAHVQVNKLKLLINFGSIIARSGMRGEADYALANAWQTQIIENFQREHPHCRCLSIEWSVWSGVGMGERLGRIDALLEAGIAPIVPEQGVAILHQLVTAESLPPSMIVTGRLGEIATLALAQKKLPFLRFLERQCIYYPGVELIIEADVSTDSDPYLSDHVVQGEQMLPGVMGLEAMAQVAMALAGLDYPPTFENVQFLQPLVVNPQEQITLRIAALLHSDNCVDVVIRCSKTHFLSNHFSARCLFTKVSDKPIDNITVDAAFNSLTINPEKDLYADLFFHQGRFVRVSAYDYIDAWQCRATIKPAENDNWFGRYLPKELVLGDPGSRDAALHALQVCIPHTTIIPVAIEKIQFIDAHCQGPWVLHAQERSHKDDLYTYDLQLIAKNGQLREVWRGVKLKKIAAKQYQQWLDDLLPAYLERQMETINQGQKIHIAVSRNTQLDNKQRGIQAIQSALRDRQAIYYSASGKPQVKGFYVSVAHSENLSLAVSATKTVSCDIERVTERKSDFWQAALGEIGFGLAEQLSENKHYNGSMTRLWTALECLKKAGLPLDIPLLIQSISNEDDWVVLQAGQYKIGSTIIKFQQDEADNKADYAIAILFSALDTE